MPPELIRKKDGEDKCRTVAAGGGRWTRTITLRVKAGRPADWAIPLYWPGRDEPGWELPDLSPGQAQTKERRNRAA